MQGIVVGDMGGKHIWEVFSTFKGFCSRERYKNNYNMRQNIITWLKRGAICIRNMKDGEIDLGTMKTPGGYGT